MPGYTTPKLQNWAASIYKGNPFINWIDFCAAEFSRLRENGVQESTFFFNVVTFGTSSPGFHRENGISDKWISCQEIRSWGEG